MRLLDANLHSPEMESIKDLASKITSAGPASDSFMSNYSHLLNSARDDLADLQNVFPGRALERMPPDDIAKLESILSESRDLNRMMEINEEIGRLQVRIKHRGAMPTYVASENTWSGKIQGQVEGYKKNVEMLTADFVTLIQTFRQETQKTTHNSKQTQT